MKGKLRLRAYNVLFGDAFLISFPERDKNGKTRQRHILIDVGNAKLDKVGGYKDFVFEPVMKNVLKELKGEPLDLYILTHEHLDHVQGPHHAAKKVSPPVKVPINCAWLTASAALDYYKRFPNSEMKDKKALFASVSEGIRALRAAGDVLPEYFQLFLNVNDPNLTDECVLYILDQAKERHFIFRDSPLEMADPFQEVKFDFWAPEEDTSLYYGGMQKIAMAMDPAPSRVREPALKRIPPPPGVDASAFNHLLEARRNSILDSMLFIDNAGNNTSLVFTLEWRGWKLLFAGDAEQKSWEMMDRQGKLSPVDFIKISHHGSLTGTPRAGLMEQLFRKGTPRKRLGLVSTFEGSYKGVPDPHALGRYQNYGVELVSVGDKCEAGKYMDIFFPEFANEPEY